MTQIEAEVILALADHNLRVMPTARSIYMHRNTVMYHLEKVRKQTGKDPANFYDLCELVKVAKAIREEV